MSEQKDFLRPVSMADSDATTYAQSKEPSVLDAEKKEQLGSVHASTAPSEREQSLEPPTAEEKEVEKVPVEEQAAERKSSSSEAGNENDEEDNFEYPKAWKLAIITLALCLSVFCMALVRRPPCLRQ